MRLGCDPELFIQRDGKIIPSREVIPFHGLKITKNDYSYGERPELVFRDGIQAEIRPKPRFCRAEVGIQIASALHAIDRAAKESKAVPSYSTSVEISLPDFAEEDLVLGCMPSLSAYGERPMNVPLDYPIRSAGGHIHMGYKPSDPQRFAKICDLHLGLVGVILDRDPLAAERRKLYGRAGEYRLPNHGFEYRTLSNFWLRAYPVMSMMFYLAREAANIDYYVRELNAPPELEQVINANDLQGARDLWKWWSAKYRELIGSYRPYYPLSDQFGRFLETSMDDHFSKNVLENWTEDATQAHCSGGETFLTNNF